MQLTAIWLQDGVKQKVAKGQRKRASLNAPNSLEVDKDRLRVEHLNYKVFL